MTPPAASRPSRRPRRRTRLSTEEVRDRLYEGALARFRDQGYEATSVSELTREAGVAKGTFFNHFPTKEHVLASWFVGVWGSVAAELAEAGIGGAEAIGHQLEKVMRQLEEDPILAGALAARITDLPDAGGVHPLNEVRRWSESRIRESLPVLVPVRAISDGDLTALLAGALVETLREAFLVDGGVATGRPEARARLGSRIGFLLASAGLQF